MERRIGVGGAAVGLLGLAVFAIASCSSDRTTDDPQPPIASPARPAPFAPNYFAGPADDSRSVVQRGARVQLALAHESLPFRDISNPVVDDDDRPDHEPGKSPFDVPFHTEPDAVLQGSLPILSMPVSIVNFLGQGQTLGGCIIPLPDGGTQAPGCTTRGIPPDTVGAVGPNHYVQAINSGIAIWNKNGSVAMAPKFTSTLWASHPQTDGNLCGAPPTHTGGDWGDAVVLYDEAADRWLITQFDITNGVNNSTGPSFQCVAVSKTGDPTGPYWTYDFSYTNAINDYGKFSVWPDAYYASFNMFDGSFSNAELCAYDRASMMKGSAATQQCFTSNDFGFLPANADGQVHPPIGEPAFFLSLGSDGASLSLYKLHVDWATPANSTFNGPTSLPVAAFNQLCSGGSCVPENSPGEQVGSLGDRPMFRLVYRNFGSHESLFANHSVQPGATGGVRWYEIRSPNATPVVYQQGTYAPADSNWRWMGSIAEDQAEDVALGYAISSATTAPGIAWTGRLAGDAVGTMGQGEAVLERGSGVEFGTLSDGTEPQRWGDYSSMTVDPTDDCTFWYTQELYPANGLFNYDTRISSMKFPGCAAKNFTIKLSPATESLQQGKTVTYTVTTAISAGTAESVALYIQDLPSGVSASFAPASVTAGTTSTLTLKATAGAAITGATSPTFTVIGKAPSAVHPVTAQVGVIAPLADAGAATDAGGTTDAGGGVTDAGGATDASGGTDANGSTDDASLAEDASLADDAGGPTIDASPTTDGSAASDSGPVIAQDSGAPNDGDAAADAAAGGGAGNSSGCGCRTAPPGRAPSWALFGFAAIAIGAVRRRGRRAAA